MITAENNNSNAPQDFCVSRGRAWFGFGMIFLLMMCDYISRVISPSIGILPIGIVTSLIGAPYFIYLLRRRRSEVGWD